MDVQAYAKINPVLDITGLRADGYHLLDTVMLQVSLCDDISIEKARGISLTMQVDGAAGLQADIPMQKNIAYKAARAILPEGAGARIHIIKRIPQQAGMGGGSADAGAVLLALNELYSLGLAEGALIDMGARLGADVPFAIAGGAARVRGIGEDIAPITPVRYDMLLVKPMRGINTREAFARWDASADRLHPDVQGFIAAYHARDYAGIAANAINALYPPALAELPSLEGIRLGLLAAGARAAFMTGSGSAMIGIFDDISASDAAEDGFPGCFCKKIHSLGE